MQFHVGLGNLHETQNSTWISFPISSLYSLYLAPLISGAVKQPNKHLWRQQPKEPAKQILWNRKTAPGIAKFQCSLLQIVYPLNLDCAKHQTKNSRDKISTICMWVQRSSWLAFEKENSFRYNCRETNTSIRIHEGLMKNISKANSNLYNCNFQACKSRWWC